MYNVGMTRRQYSMFRHACDIFALRDPSAMGTSISSDRSFPFTGVYAQDVLMDGGVDQAPALSGVRCFFAMGQNSEDGGAVSDGGDSTGRALMELEETVRVDSGWLVRINLPGDPYHDTWWRVAGRPNLRHTPHMSRRRPAAKRLNLEEIATPSWWSPQTTEGSETVPHVITGEKRDSLI